MGIVHCARPNRSNNLSIISCVNILFRPLDRHIVYNIVCTCVRDFSMLILSECCVAVFIAFSLPLETDYILVSDSLFCCSSYRIAVFKIVTATEYTSGGHRAAISFRKRINWRRGYGDAVARSISVLFLNISNHSRFRISPNFYLQSVMVSANEWQSQGILSKSS